MGEGSEGAKEKEFQVLSDCGEGAGVAVKFRKENMEAG